MFVSLTAYTRENHTVRTIVFAFFFSFALFRINRTTVWLVHAVIFIKTEYTKKKVKKIQETHNVTSVDTLSDYWVSSWKCNSKKKKTQQWQLTIKYGDSLKETRILLVCDGFISARE